MYFWIIYYNIRRMEEIKNIPLIIPVFNQLTYTRNLINWFRWYYPENKIYIIDNGSTYEPLIDYYKETGAYYYNKMYLDNINLLTSHDNNFIENLRGFLSENIYDYYIISDPDIMPHPNTPPNFLEIFKDAIDNKGFHRAGFGLITDDLPEELNEREMIIGNESALLNQPIPFYFNEKRYDGFKAPLDTTFCLYKRDNGGWSSPMNGNDWGNCLRLFKAHHLGWYVNPNFVNEEMDYYFKSAKYRVPGEPSAGANNNRPEQYK